jgi:hypothetical protein
MVRFDIKSNKSKKSEIPEPPKVEKIKNTELYQRLIEYFCVRAKDASNILKQYPENQILENLAYVEHQHKLDKVKNIGPYTLKAIKEDYKLQLSLFDKEKEATRKDREKKEREERKLIERKKLYNDYRRGMIEDFKNSIPPDELERLQSKCHESVSKTKGQNRIGLSGFVRLEMEKCIAEKAKILKFDEWASENEK